MSAIGDDARRERNAASLEPARIALPVPALVVREHAVGEIGIEAMQRLEHVGARGGVRGDGSTIGGGELLVVVDDVEERFVDLSDVVEERDALDALALVLRELGGVAEDERIGRDAPDVGAGLGIVGVDGVEQRFERRGGEPLGRLGGSARVEGALRRPRRRSRRRRRGRLGRESWQGGGKTRARTVGRRGRPADGRGQTKRPAARVRRGVSHEVPATAYSPASSRTEYHRRCRA